MAEMGYYYFKCIECELVIKDSSDDINYLNIGEIIHCKHSKANKEECNGDLRIIKLIDYDSDNMFLFNQARIEDLS